MYRYGAMQKAGGSGNKSGSGPLPISITTNNVTTIITYALPTAGTTAAPQGMTVNVAGVNENVIQVQASGSTLIVSHIGGATAGQDVLVSYDGSADWTSGGVAIAPFTDEVSTNITPP